MAHYARVNAGIVEQVIVADDSYIQSLVGDTPGEWVKTSYNMYGGKYIDPATGEAAADQSVVTGDAARERKNYAGIGFHYDGVGFYPPKPYASWTFNSTTYLWEPPVAHPSDTKVYDWNEETRTWDEVS